MTLANLTYNKITNNIKYLISYQIDKGSKDKH